MAIKDPYSSFDPNKIIGKSGGRPYLRPSSSSQRSVGLTNALKQLRRSGSEGSNLSSENANVIHEIIEDQLKGKTSASFTYHDRMELRHKLEQARIEGKLTSYDVKDAMEIIDRLSE